MFREIGLIWRIPVYDDTVTVNPRSLRLLLDLAGPEHVLLGLDWVWAAKSGGLMDAVGRPGPGGPGPICRQNALDHFGGKLTLRIDNWRYQYRLISDNYFCRLTTTRIAGFA